MTTFVLNKKIDEVERKKKDFCGFVTNTPFNAKIGVEKEILSISGLVQKTDYNAKIPDFHVIYFTTFEYN